jgi:hypothetical protein
MNKAVGEFSWQQTFVSSAEALSSKNYDLESLTLSKTEIALTGLLAHEIMTFDESRFAYIGVENPVSKNSSKRTSPSNIDSVGDSNPAFQKPDLLILDSHNLSFRIPTLYAEFKFFYNWDVNPSGEVNKRKDLDDILKDTDKLTRFKSRTPQTICIQGTFFCRNDKQQKYIPTKNGAEDQQRQVSHKGFIDYYKKELRKTKPSCTVISDKVIPLVWVTESSRTSFWLDLVLLEIGIK